MKYCIVVARYTENIEWTKQFENVIIYNKGDELNDGCDEILLPNVGREGHTFYKHISNNYDNLTDYIIFLQGNPYDHCPNIIEIINNFINNPDINIDYGFLCNRIIDCNLIGCGSHPGLPLIDVYEKLFNERKEYMDFNFVAGGQFIVSKKAILNRPKEFYDKIVEAYFNRRSFIHHRSCSDGRIHVNFHG